MEGSNWTIEFSWVKAHVGIYGNELGDQLAKAGPRNRDTTIAFNRLPKSTLYSEIEEENKNGKRMGGLYEGSHKKTVVLTRTRQA